MSDTKGSVIGTIISLGLDSVLTCVRSSYLISLATNPDSIYRVRVDDETAQQQSAITVLLFPTPIGPNSEVTIDGYRNTVQFKVNALQELLSVVFNCYAGTLRPVYTGGDVTYYYLFYYIPLAFADSLSVQVGDGEDAVRAIWSKLDILQLQEKLQSAISRLTDKFTDRPYGVETADKLFSIIDAPEFEVLLDALSHYGVKQQDRDSWYVPIVDLNRAIGMQQLQLHMYKKDDERRREGSAETVNKSGGDDKVKMSVKDELNEQEERFRNVYGRDPTTMTKYEVQALAGSEKDKRFASKKNNKSLVMNGKEVAQVSDIPQESLDKVASKVGASVVEKSKVKEFIEKEEMPTDGIKDRTDSDTPTEKTTGKQAKVNPNNPKSVKGGTSQGKGAKGKKR